MGKQSATDSKKKSKAAESPQQAGRATGNPVEDKQVRRKYERLQKKVRPIIEDLRGIKCAIEGSSDLVKAMNEQMLEAGVPEQQLYDEKTAVPGILNTRARVFSDRAPDDSLLDRLRSQDPNEWNLLPAHRATVEEKLSSLKSEHSLRVLPAEKLDRRAAGLLKEIMISGVIKPKDFAILMSEVSKALDVNVGRLLAPLSSALHRLGPPMLVADYFCQDSKDLYQRFLDLQMLSVRLKQEALAFQAMLREVQTIQRSADSIWPGEPIPNRNAAFAIAFRAIVLRVIPDAEPVAIRRAIHTALKDFGNPDQASIKTGMPNLRQELDSPKNRRTRELFVRYTRCFPRIWC